MRGVRAGAWGGRDGGSEVQVDAHCRCLSHDVSDLALEAAAPSSPAELITRCFTVVLASSPSTP